MYVDQALGIGGTAMHWLPRTKSGGAERPPNGLGMLKTPTNLAVLKPPTEHAASPSCSAAI